VLPVLRPSCTEAEIAAVSDVLRSGWWGQGPVCAEFERRLAARYGYAHCVSVNSATAALHLALKAAGVGPGDEVIVPALTFVSTALAVVYCGAKPVFADVQADTLCLDWNDALDKASDRTRAIIPVDYAGYPAGPTLGCEVFPNVVQDAAHSCGGLGYGDMVCLSFHPVKPLASPDGGAVLTNDAEQAARLRALAWCGIDKSTWQRTGKRYTWDYSIGEIGYKCHWNDVAAAIGLAQLDRLAEMQARRRQIAARYTAELEGLCQTPPDHPAHTWHLYAVRVEAERRDWVLDHLASRGIGAGVHYKPLTYYPPLAGETPPVTEREWRRLMSLPIYADMTDQEQEQVIAALREVL
jgi:perosamine synthetase